MNENKLPRFHIFIDYIVDGYYYSIIDKTGFIQIPLLFNSKDIAQAICDLINQEY